MRRSILIVILFVASISLLTTIHGSGNSKKKPYQPKIAPASPQAVKAIKGFRIPKGIDVKVTAAEPLLANPIAFCIDHQGRFYVAETFRLHAGVTDNRQHMNWLQADLASRTVADRVAMYKKYLGKKFASYGIEHDRIRRLIDTNDDGILDKANVFADGFHQPADGLGSGVLARGNKVWYTCIPDLWYLEDKTGDGKADVKKSLHNGYGIHVAFLGHDMHGLKFGPDGKLYFSIGDRGLHVKTQEGTILSKPDTGSVLRCNPDGSELELVATGLRNPQELVFDEYGNLFTGDNNADGGDKARWVHLVEGSDSGWRIGYQYLNKPTRLGPWNAEKLWHPRHPGQSAHMIPPLANLASGPSGLTYHPGVSQLPLRYRKHFFLCDFRGGPGNSGIRAFTLKQNGATWKVDKQEEFIWNILPTDVDFGPDGALYWSDWINGWGLPNKGRLYKVTDPKQRKDPLVTQVKQLLATGMSKRSDMELSQLLGHADMRVRQEAQFALAKRGVPSIKTFTAVAKKSKNTLARIHALWGLGQIMMNTKTTAAQRLQAAQSVWTMTATNPPEVRAQLAKILRHANTAQVNKKLTTLVNDADPRVRLQATMSLGKLRAKSALPAIVKMVRDNNDADVYLRHAGVMALVWMNDHATLLNTANDSSKAVRLASLLAMRRLRMPEIARFLNDPDTFLVLEAARAINDAPIPQAFPQLAAVAQKTKMSNAFTYRALNAHFRLGKRENAIALARYAARSKNPDKMRLEAFHHLQNWAKPAPLDRVMGLYRPLSKRPKQVAVAAVRDSLGGILVGSNKIQTAGVKLAAKLGITELGPTLLQLVKNTNKTTTVRLESLKALEKLKDSRLRTAMKAALVSKDARLRAEARRVFANIDPKAALPEIKTALAKGKVVEKQGALTVLGKWKSKAVDPILTTWVERLLRGKVAPELQLELIEAVQRRSDPVLRVKLNLYTGNLPKKNVVAQHGKSLYGGDADAGRRIFIERTSVSCVRCHKVKGVGGDVGPDLSDIGKKQKRPYLLEAIVAPSKHIAKGYETVIVVLNNGQFKSGILKSQNKKEIRLVTQKGTIMTIPRTDIDEFARNAKSSMPDDMMRHLSPRDLRNLVEFLANLR